MNKLEDKFAFDSMMCRGKLAQQGGMIQMNGNYSVEMETSCNTCLKPVSLKLDQEFDLRLINEESYTEPEGDVEISLRSEDVDFYKEQELNLSEYFEDQLLLDLPFSIKCSEECKGICPLCGVNRNTESCRCHEKSGNHPFSALGDLEY